MNLPDYDIVKEKEYPQNGPTELVKYDVEVEIEGEKHRKGFNLDPGQDIHGHIARWLRTFK